MNEPDLKDAMAAHREWLASKGKRGARLTLEDEVFAGIDLTYARLTEAVLPGCNFNQGVLSHADLFGANLAAVSLSRARLEDAGLSKANLDHAILKGAQLRGARLFRASLVEADLEEAVLAGADLSHAYLFGANLRAADLSGVKLEGAALTGARFSETSRLTNAQGIDAKSAEHIQVDGVRLDGPD